MKKDNCWSEQSGKKSTVPLFLGHPVYTGAHAHTYIHTYIHTYMYTYMYIHTYIPLHTDTTFLTIIIHVCCFRYPTASTGILLWKSDQRAALPQWFWELDHFHVGNRSSYHWIETLIYRLCKIWFDLIWFDLIWFDLIWFDLIWSDLIWFDLIWFDLIWSDLIWFDLIWFDLIWFDLIWFDLIWFDLIWSDLIWSDLIRDELSWFGVGWISFHMISILTDLIRFYCLL